MNTHLESQKRLEPETFKARNTNLDEPSFGTPHESDYMPEIGTGHWFVYLPPLRREEDSQATALFALLSKVSNQPLDISVVRMRGKETGWKS